MKSIAILNSRQNLRPIGLDGWITASAQAAQAVGAQGNKLLTSLGMNTWELLVYLAAINKINQKIYIPLKKDQNQSDIAEYYTRQFQLKSDITEWRFIDVNEDNRGGHLFQKERDRRIIMDSDIIYPIALRRGSSLRNCISKLTECTAVIDDTFKIEYNIRKESYKLDIDKRLLNPEIDNALDDFIIHWTRTSNRPWPGETLYEYYGSIVNSTSVYPRSSFDTLVRIVTERKLRASSRHYRRGNSAVAFSELKPSEAVDLMKWRARYREMTFEPYGIALRKRCAREIGVRKVIYCESKLYSTSDTIDQPYFQSIGTKGFWVLEKEWRHVGDIDLSLVDPNDIRVIVWKSDEIELMGNNTKYKVVPINDSLS